MSEQNDNTQKNNKFKLCGDRADTVNSIINEYGNLVQKEYKTRHNWEGKVIYKDI